MRASALRVATLADREQDTPEEVADFVLSLPEGTRLYLCIPLRLDDGAAAGKPGRARPPVDAGRPCFPRRPFNCRKTRDDPPGSPQQGFVRLLVQEKLVELGEAVSEFWRKAAKRCR